MYLGLTYSIAEMSPALPHTGGAYSFARTAFGPWGGFITGISQNIEFVLTPAVIVFFIGSYLTAIFETPTAFQPIWWILGYIIFVGLNARGVQLSFTVTVIVTLLAIAILLVFFLTALPIFDFSKYALNIGADPATGAAIELPGHGPFLPAAETSCCGRRNCVLPLVQPYYAQHCINNRELPPDRVTRTGLQVGPAE